MGTLSKGSIVGRYVVLEQIGAGGMGIVYAAYDPELDRKIALKLLRPEQAGDEARIRLLREAQALARLSHPNVVAVYDVGALDDQIFIAMAFVEGKTLSSWRREEPRSWREVLEVFLQAGEGLAAAHHADIVHRDFKPDNVLLGADGKVRVLDFGLARAAGERDLPYEGLSPTVPSPLASPVTRASSVIGTLPYMAPEQPRSQGADARSDQFSFCVTFYEALYNEPPFVGETPGQLLRSALAGRFRPPPADSTVPGWLREVLLKGLSVPAKRRYPTMDALLAALAHRPGQQRRRWAAAASLGLALTLGLIYLLLGGPWVQPCSGAERKLEGIWDSHQKSALREVLANLPEPFAPIAWYSLESILDDYARRWTQMHVEACEATQVHGEQSPELLDLRMLCLDRRLAELETLVGLLEQPDSGLLESSVSMAQGLGSLGPCSDPGTLLAAAEPPAPLSAHRPRFEAAQREMAQARVLVQAGRYPDALARARQAADEAEGIEDRPLLAEARVLVGRVERLLEHIPQAQDNLQQGFFLAEATSQDAVAVSAAVELATLTGLHTAGPEEGRRWLQHAEAKLERLPGEQPLLEADLDDTAGLLHRQEGLYQQALDAHLHALEARSRELGEQDLAVARSAHNVASDLGSLGRHEEALDYNRRALAIETALVGPTHPVTADTHNNLGIALRNLGRLDEALGELETAYETFRATLGPEHRRVVAALNNLGNTLHDLGRHEEAVERLAEARRIVTATPNHPDLSLTLFNQAGSLQALERHEEALELFLKVLELDRAQLGDEHPYVADGYFYIAEELLALDRAAEAVNPLERALAIQRRAQVPADRLGATCFYLAKALDATGGSKKRSLELARQARAHFVDAGERFLERLAEVESWLVERKPARELESAPRGETPAQAGEEATTPEEPAPVDRS